MKKINKIIRNICLPAYVLSKCLSRSDLDHIEKLIRDIETSSGIQLVFAYQTNSTIRYLIRDISTRSQAEEHFSRLKIWDTELNNGILFYFHLANREFEIIVDRGIRKQVAQERWFEISAEIEEMLQQKSFAEAVSFGLQAIGSEVSEHFKRDVLDEESLEDRNLENELCDYPKRVR